MDLTDAKAFINLISAEYKRRADLLPEDDEGTGYAYDQWMFTDLIKPSHPAVERHPLTKDQKRQLDEDLKNVEDRLNGICCIDACRLRRREPACKFEQKKSGQPYGGSRGHWNGER